MKAFERLVYRENGRLGLSHSKELNKQQHREDNAMNAAPDGKKAL